jgi:hypothetical protein
MLTDSLDVYLQDIDDLAKYDFNEKKKSDLKIIIMLR